MQVAVMLFFIYRVIPKKTIICVFTAYYISFRFILLLLFSFRLNFNADQFTKWKDVYTSDTEKREGKCKESNNG